MFGEDREIRLRPSFFPFTEPSVEMDISCMMCHGKGCGTCKGTGWIEILGAGMVHRTYLKWLVMIQKNIKVSHSVWAQSVSQC